MTELVWQCRRANCVQWLNIYDWSQLVNVLPSLAVATIFGSQCGSLQALSIDGAAVGLLGSEIAALAALTGLRRLEVWFLKILS